MTKKHQKRIVRELTKDITDSIKEHIDNGWVPEEWDGHEIRCWVSELYSRAAEMSFIRREPRSKRAREYRNTILVKNL